jgi:capsular exopolysaccharide synthesis family protein
MLLELRRSGVSSLMELRSTVSVGNTTSLPRLPVRRRGLCFRNGSIDYERLYTDRIRHLRDQLFTVSDGQLAVKTVVVTSALPGEGKSMLVRSLAEACSRKGAKVLVVDGDLRCPSQLRLAGRASAGVHGLSEVLEGEISVAEAVVADSSGISIMPTGVIRERTADRLVSRQFSVLLDHLRRSYDVVIIDAPPVLAVSDALGLARAVDASVLVVRADSTPRAAVISAAEEIRSWGGRIAAVVLSGVDPLKSSTGQVSRDAFVRHSTSYYRNVS